MRHYDLAIAGSGYAGSLMAMVASRLGFSVILLEKGKHPRMAIGESSTPLSNLLLESLAEKYDLPMLRPLTKWGSWQQSYPGIACGLKRGFTFFHHDLSGREADTRDRQLLVAASPHDTIADTHWFRADFDQFLMEQARALGVEYLDSCNVYAIARDGAGWALSCWQDKMQVKLRAGFIIDATGPRGFLHNVLTLREIPLPEYPATSAFYSHFTGVKNFAGAQQYAASGPPYPPDAAALHHVFDGGWMWVLHFNNGWTSAGFAASRAVADQFGFGEKEAAWQRLLDRLPEVKEQFACAKSTRPFTFAPHLSFRSSRIVGQGWAMLPSAAGFVDPLLSTGFPLTLLGVLRLGKILERDWGTSKLESRLAQYAEETDAELLATAELIGALYANMGDFALFRTLSLLYFTAASYAETVRRLGKSHLAQSFLLHTDPVFGPEFRRITALARQTLSVEGKRLLDKRIFSLIESFDVAGLCKRPSDHCYPVQAGDLFEGAHKVQASVQEIESLLSRADFYKAIS